MENGRSDEFKKNNKIPEYTKNNKTPEYAKDYKREYQIIRGINKEFEYFINFMRYDDVEYKPHKIDRIMGFVKRFLRAQEKGRLKDISDFEFDYDDIYNIIKLKEDLPEYYCIIQNFHDWSKYEESFVSRYDIYKHDLELFLSKLNIEDADTDDDYSCDSGDDCDIDYTGIGDSDSD